MGNPGTAFLPSSAQPNYPSQSEGTTFVNATGFFQQFPDDVMKATVCTQAVLEFQPTNAQFMESE